MDMKRPDMSPFYSKVLYVGSAGSTQVINEPSGQKVALTSRDILSLL